ncbi:MAG: hypothetical protein U0R17_04545 [Acidimicrobiia bacterium]
MDTFRIISISGHPTDEELAAILAAGSAYLNAQKGHNTPRMDLLPGKMSWQRKYRERARFA